MIKKLPTMNNNFPGKLPVSTRLRPIKTPFHLLSLKHLEIFITRMVFNKGEILRHRNLAISHPFCKSMKLALTLCAQASLLLQLNIQFTMRRIGIIFGRFSAHKPLEKSAFANALQQRTVGRYAGRY